MFSENFLTLTPNTLANSDRGVVGHGPLEIPKIEFCKDNFLYEILKGSLSNGMVVHEKLFAYPSTASFKEDVSKRNFALIFFVNYEKSGFSGVDDVSKRLVHSN
jgi:hypothetical protein